MGALLGSGGGWSFCPASILYCRRLDSQIQIPGLPCLQQGLTGLYTGWSVTVAGAFVYRPCRRCGFSLEGFPIWVPLGGEGDTLAALACLALAALAVFCFVFMCRPLIFLPPKPQKKTDFFGSLFFHIFLFYPHFLSQQFPSQSNFFHYTHKLFSKMIPSKLLKA